VLEEWYCLEERCDARSWSQLARLMECGDGFETKTRENSEFGFGFLFWGCCGGCMSMKALVLRSSYEKRTRYAAIRRKGPVQWLEWNVRTESAGILVKSLSWYLFNQFMIWNEMPEARELTFQRWKNRFTEWSKLGMSRSWISWRYLVVPRIIYGCAAVTTYSMANTSPVATRGRVGPSRMEKEFLRNRSFLPDFVAIVELSSWSSNHRSLATMTPTDSTLQVINASRRGKAVDWPRIVRIRLLIMILRRVADQLKQRWQGRQWGDDWGGGEERW
jgi:hypothetical protein